MYMLIIYFIHVKCANITLSHHLQLKVHVTSLMQLKDFLVAKLLQLFSSHKL
jgi:hypothetical protein